MTVHFEKPGNYVNEVLELVQKKVNTEKNDKVEKKGKKEVK